MFVLDADRLIKLTNASGKALLSRRELFLERRGALSCRHSGCDRRMAAAIRAMADERDGGAERHAVALRREDGLNAVATLHALREDGDIRHRSVRILLTVFEPGARTSTDPELLAEAYGLTAAEARTAALVAAGRGTAHCARALGVKTSTLRSHLLAIYRKTGANGKADLVRMVLLLCAT